MGKIAYILPWVSLAVGLLAALGKPWKVILGIVLALAVIAGLSNVQTSRERSAQEARERDLQQNFDRVRAEKGDVAAIQQLLEVANTAVAKLSAADSQKVVDEQAAHLEEERRAHQVVLEASAKVAVPVVLRWTPAQEAVISSFETQVKAWHEKGQLVALDPTPTAVAVLGTEEVLNAYVARMARLPDGSWIRLTIIPGSVQGGKVTKNWSAYLTVYLTGRQAIEPESITLSPDETWVNAAEKELAPFDGWQGKDDPAKSDDFRRAVVQGTAASLNYLILRAAPQADTRP